MKDKKIIITYLILLYIVVGFILISCSAERKISNLATKHPEALRKFAQENFSQPKDSIIFNTDTLRIVQIDTIIEYEKGDSSTLMVVGNDVYTIGNSGIQHIVDVVRDTIRIKSKCKDVELLRILTNQKETIKSLKEVHRTNMNDVNRLSNLLNDKVAQNRLNEQKIKKVQKRLRNLWIIIIVSGCVLVLINLGKIKTLTKII